MSPTAPRRTVECQSCHAVLGTINRGDPQAPQGIVSRIITAEREVRVFVDLVMGEAGFLCPSCGAGGGAGAIGTGRGGGDAVAVGRVTERAWQDTIMQAARALGYACYHTYDSRRSAPGFPDLVLAKPGRLVFIEVKTERGRLSPWQRLWLDMLGSVPGVVALVARPSDWDRVEAMLKDQPA